MAPTRTSPPATRLFPVKPKSWFSRNEPGWRKRLSAVVAGLALLVVACPVFSLPENVEDIVLVVGVVLFLAAFFAWLIAFLPVLPTFIDARYGTFMGAREPFLARLPAKPPTFPATA